jgi:pimeloyl-ACP methyl ester carboxylesterase
MIVELAGRLAHAATGGVNVDVNGGSPVVLLVHGAGMDGTVWCLQTRSLAYRGVRALAVDLPGHGRSEGPALESIEAIAEWLGRFVDAVGLADPVPVHLVGHSMGTFVALELVSRRPELVASITLCATATAMPVHPELLDAARHDLPAAAALVAAWGHARPAHVGGNPTPGLWMLGGARALVENSAPGVLATDFTACADYQGAIAAAERVTVPATVVIGLGDKMTPPRSGRELASALTIARVVELADTGHQMMIENPRAVRRTILESVGL